MRWGIFSPNPCSVCALKDAVIERLRDDLARERLRLDRAETVSRRAIDQLLVEKGKPGLAPVEKWTGTDADAAMSEMLALFRDADDRGDGKIVDMDNLGIDHR